MASKNYALRLPEDLYEKLKVIAEEEQRSLNAQIVVMLNDVVKGREKSGNAEEIMNFYKEQAAKLKNPQ